MNSTMIRQSSLLRRQFGGLFTRQSYNKKVELFSLNYGKKYLKNTVNMYFKKKNVDTFFLNDIAYRVICQYPGLRNNFVELIKQHGDLELLKIWDSMKLDNNSYPKYFPFRDKSNDDLYIEKSDYLALGKDVTVKVCSWEKEIKEATEFIESANKSGFNVVGFDCQWMSISKEPIVSIIQVSLNNTCFIIDALYGDHSQVSTFIKTLFDAENLIKVAKRTKKDLVILSRSYGNVEVLKKPVHSICLVKLIELICREYNNKVKKINGEISNNIDSSTPNCEESVNECDDVKKFLIRMEELKNVKNYKLSQLSEIFLGKKIDKTETRSVWDRRPLRVSQLRHAAINVEASRMIYFKLEELGNELNIDVKKLVLNCRNV